MKKLKILILVLSVNDKKFYSKFYHTQKKTWDSIKVEGVDTYYFFGNSISEKIVSNNIFLPIKESFQNCGYKTIRTFQLLKNIEFDYIFRTNSSSYIDKKLLYNYLIDKPKTNFYSGVIGDLNGNKFASGSGYVLSKDLVEVVLDNLDLWNHDYIDDVALGILLNKIGHRPVEAPRFDIDIHNFFHNIFNKVPLNFYHYRLKSKNRNFDISQMKKIYKNKNKFINNFL